MSKMSIVCIDRNDCVETTRILISNRAIGMSNKSGNLHR